MDPFGQSSGSIRSGSVRSVQWIHSASPIHSVRPVDPFGQSSGSILVSPVDPFSQTSGSIRSVQWIHLVRPVDPFSQTSGSVRPVPFGVQNLVSPVDPFGQSSGFSPVDLVSPEVSRVQLCEQFGKWFIRRMWLVQKMVTGVSNVATGLSKLGLSEDCGMSCLLEACGQCSF